jgi:hypothetical protein
MSMNLPREGNKNGGDICLPRDVSLHHGSFTAGRLLLQSGACVTAKASEKWGVVPTVLGGLRSGLTSREPTWPLQDC